MRSRETMKSSQGKILDEALPEKEPMKGSSVVRVRGAVHGSVEGISDRFAWPNKAPEPTPCAVMPRAAVPKMKSSSRIALPFPARVMPAQGVAHL